jgi:hypothetical protein
MTKLKMLRAEFEALSALCWEVGGLALRDALSERIEESVTKVDAALKAVEDEQRWIPFEEPDIGEAMYRDVLVITEDESIQIATYVDPGGFLGLNELFSDIVTHWRPLPEHPRKKEERK